MKMRSVAPMKIAKIGYIIMSLLFCIVGAVFIISPEISTFIIGVAVGAALLVFGMVKLIGYFCKDLFRLAFQYDLEFGIFLLILGIIVLINPKNLMNFICIALGIAILLDGLFKIRIALDSKKFGIGSWWAILVIAIITSAAGTALIFDSASGAGLLTVLLGIALLAEGILNLYTVISTVLIIKNQRPDVIEAEYVEINEKDV